MFDLKNLTEGWANYVVKDQAIEDLAKERAKECSECVHSVESKYMGWVGDEIKEIEGMGCDLCNCPFSGMLRAPDAECKINKW